MDEDSETTRTRRGVEMDVIIVIIIIDTIGDIIVGRPTSRRDGRGERCARRRRRMM